MSHTYTWTPDGNEESLPRITIHHNGDYSGDATLSIRKNEGHSWETTLPCAALVDFARDATINQAIGALEDLLDSRCK